MTGQPPRGGRTESGAGGCEDLAFGGRDWSNRRVLETELIPAVERGSRRLMIVLHGLGDSMDGYRWLPNALRVPSLNYLLVNGPDEYYGGHSWYDFAGDPGQESLAAAPRCSNCSITSAPPGFPLIKR